ncbi:MAG TPA: hypothetical protein VIV11_07085 [Kofleriaceae bacterium]
MKLYGTIAIHVHAEDILRTPKFWDKLKRAFGGKPDLRTGHQRASLEATAIVEAARDALRNLGATNAISLVVDNTVLFHDRDGKPDDLGDLFLAFHDNSSVFGEGFDELRLAVEHHEAGLHVVIELQARSEHPKGTPAMRVVISGRIEALTPRPGEDAEAYRKRAEPIAGDTKALELYRAQFTAFAERVRNALAATMPTARVEIEKAEPRIVRPNPNAKDAAPEPPDSRNYDPFLYYYPSPLYFTMDMLMWSAMFSMMMPPHFTVVDHHNHVQGYADDPGIQQGPTASEPAAGGDNYWSGDNEAGADTGADAGTDTGADAGGGWWDGDGGGDFGGGDFDI